MNIPDNIEIHYRTNGSIFKLTEYTTDRKRHGISIWWQKNGKPWYEMHYINDSRHGVHKTWDSSGALTVVKIYSNGEDITDKVLFIVNDLFNITDQEKTLIALAFGII